MARNPRQAPASGGTAGRKPAGTPTPRNRKEQTAAQPVISDEQITEALFAVRGAPPINFDPKKPITPPPMLQSQYHQPPPNNPLMFHDAARGELQKPQRYRNLYGDNDAPAIGATLNARVPTPPTMSLRSGLPESLNKVTDTNAGVQNFRRADRTAGIPRPLDSSRNQVAVNLMVDPGQAAAVLREPVSGNAIGAPLPATAFPDPSDEVLLGPALQRRQLADTGRSSRDRGITSSKGAVRFPTIEQLYGQAPMMPTDLAGMVAPPGANQTPKAQGRA